MRRFAAVASIALLAVPVAASATAVLRKGFLNGGVPDLPCAIQIDFGSSASGPDIDAWGPIHSYIARSKEIDEAGAWGWGTEGEFSVCLTFFEPQAIHQVFEDILKLAPTTPAKNGGWIAIKLGPRK